MTIHMEEKKKRNVADIVNSLRQPAVITNRKILRPARHLPGFSCGCSQNNATSSLLSVIGDANDEDEGVLYKNYNFDEVRDSSTQTSKTIIQLAKLETGDMSPDSLSPSSPKVHHEYLNAAPADSAHSNFDSFTLDGSTSEYSSSYRVCKKSNMMHYLEHIEEKTVEVQPAEVTQTHRPHLPLLVTSISRDKDVIKEKYPKSSLIETFLNKTKSRGPPNHRKPAEECSCGDRARFLRQKSPLNKHMKDGPPNRPSELKSRSFVDTYHPNCAPEEPEKVQHPHSRFTVKHAQQASVDAQAPLFGKEEPPLRVTSENRQRYCPAMFYQNRRSNSFMLPTLASEQKSKLEEVRHIRGLMSPIRRGRSSSPKHVVISNKVEVFRQEVDRDKIPYIDQSLSELSSPYNTVVKERRSLMERQGSPSKLSPIPAPDFQMDMMRIDRLSLSLSSDDINGDRMALDSMSLQSTENALSGILLRVQDSDWNVALKGLAEVTEMCRTMDPEIMLPHMITINQRLIELLKSPRSHVCRTACQAAGHLFESMKDTRGPEFNDIVDLLLCKTADANKFIRQDANLALDCMVTHVPTFHAIRAISSRGPTHKNHLVRCASVRLIICAVVIAGPHVILNPASNEITRKRIFQNMIRFLEDKNLETRKYGERLYKVLSKEPTFDGFLKKYMDKDDLTRMRKTLKFMVGKK